MFPSQNAAQIPRHVRYLLGSITACCCVVIGYVNNYLNGRDLADCQKYLNKKSEERKEEQRTEQPKPPNNKRNALGLRQVTMPLCWEGTAKRANKFRL